MPIWVHTNLKNLGENSKSMDLNYSTNFMQFEGELKDILHNMRLTKDTFPKEPLRPVFTPLIMLLEKVTLALI